MKNSWLGMKLSTSLLYTFVSYLLSWSHKTAAVNLTLILIDFIVRKFLVTESLENKLALLVRGRRSGRG